MQCRDAMLTLVYKCTEQTTAAECARVMRDEKLGFMPVVSASGELIGVVTDRDLTVRVLAEGKPGDTKVKDLLSPGPLVTCKADDSLESLEQKMGERKKGRAVAVDVSGKPIGIISLSDIARVERSAVRTSRLLREVTERESVAIAHY